MSPWGPELYQNGICILLILNKISITVQMFDVSPRTQKSRSTFVLNHFNPDGPVHFRTNMFWKGLEMDHVMLELRVDHSLMTSISAFFNLGSSINIGFILRVHLSIHYVHVLSWIVRRSPGTRDTDELWA